MYKIVGAKGNIQNIDDFLAKINNFCKENNVAVQVFDAEMIYGKNHLISSYLHAKRAIKEKTNSTNSLAMEILLYASFERQLKLAIPKMGVKKGKKDIAFLLIGDKIKENDIQNLLDELCLERDDKVIEGNINTLKKLGFKPNELETISKDKYVDLILEKVAMVDIIK